MRSVSFQVKGMKYDGCTRTLQSVLSAQAGVKQVVVSLESGRADVIFDAGVTTETVVASAIEGAGFEVPAGCP